MPIDANTIAAATDGINQVANTISVAQTTKKQRKWAEAQYDKQRQHALDDWSTQNAYNSPAAQMQRLKEAGLNPHLVYGNGADATSGQMPRQSDTGSYDAEAPKMDFDAQRSLMNYYDTQFRQQQTDNLAVQRTLMEQQAIHTAAQTASTLAGTAKTKLETDTLSQLQQTTVDAARANLNKILLDSQYTSDENKRKQDLHSGNLRQQAQDYIKSRLDASKTIQETKQIKEAVENMNLDEQLKKLEIDIRKRGGNPNDPYWQKKLQEILEKGFGGLHAPIIEKRKPATKFTDWLDRLSPY